MHERDSKTPLAGGFRVSCSERARQLNSLTPRYPQLKKEREKVRDIKMQATTATAGSRPNSTAGSNIRRGNKPPLRRERDRQPATPCFYFLLSSVKREKMGDLVG